MVGKVGLALLTFKLTRSAELTALSRREGEMEETERERKGGRRESTEWCNCTVTNVNTVYR